MVRQGLVVTYHECDATAAAAAAAATIRPSEAAVAAVSAFIHSALSDSRNFIPLFVRFEP